MKSELQKAMRSEARMRQPARPARWLSFLRSLLLLLACALPIGVHAAKAILLFQDNFNADTDNTSDLNRNIERQAGPLAPLFYTMAFDTQCCGHQLQNPNALNQLLLADFSFSTSALDYDFIGSNSQGGFKISFDVDPLPAVYGTDDLTVWGAINLGMDADARLTAVNGGAVHFGVLFRADGRLQAFDGASVVTPEPEPVFAFSRGYHHIDLVISDTDGNAFDGVGGTTIEVYADNAPLPVYSFRKAGGYSHNYINLQGLFRAHFDNLRVARLSITQPIPINGSFESDAFTVFPGYVSLNGPIRGWNAAPGHGVNPGTFGGPFTDNGTIPNGLQAAFLQQNGVLSQVVTDFTVGALYQLRYFENARNCCSEAPPFLEVQVGGATIVAAHPVSPVGGTNGYREVISEPFTATTTALEVAFIKSSPQDGDNTVLLDHVQFFQGPTLLQQPLSQTNPIGSSVTFTAQAVGAQPLTYQWRLNGVNIPFATSPSFTIGGAEVNSGGSYSVIVSSPYGVVLSPPAVLQIANVDAFPPALSDNFASRGDLTLNLTRRLQGNTCSATREPGEPFHAGRVGHHSVWYRWHADVDGIATFRTRGSAFDTLLAVYTGATLNTLRLVASDDDSGGFHTSQVQFNAVSGIEYAIAIDGKGDDCGGFMLTWNFEVTSLLLPVIASQPQSRSVLLGQQHVFTVTASGQNLYQWFFNGSLISGATEARFVRERVRPEDVGFYFVRITEQNTGRIVDSRTAILELGPVPSVQSVATPEDSFFGAESGSGGGGGQELFQAASVSAPGGGLGIPVPRGGVGRQIWSNMQGSTAIAQCGVAPTATRWLLLSNAADGILVIHTEGSRNTAGQPMKSVATVYRQDVTGLPIYVPQVACAVANDPTHTYAVVRFFAQANTGYWIAADGVNSSGLVQLNWVHSQWPIRMQPVEQLTVPLGRSVNLGVNVEWNVSPDAAAPLSMFRWTLNQQTPFLTEGAVRKFANVQLADAGRYSISASNIAVWTNLSVTLQVDSSMQTVVESTFDALNNEGWTLGLPGAIGQGNAATPLWASDFHCGYLSYAPPATSWLAPLKFRGNQSAAYGGVFEFALRQSQTTVLLRGAGLTLVFPSGFTPWSNGAWANYRIPLTARGWTVNGRAATEIELMQALASVTSLEIFPSTPTFAGAGDLDDVALLGPVVDTVAYLVIRALPGGVAQIEWPLPGRSLVLEEGSSTTDPRNPMRWSQVAFPYVTNVHYISVNVPIQSGGRVYRLHRP